jgi:hypothetical protein
MQIEAAHSSHRSTSQQSRPAHNRDAKHAGGSGVPFVCQLPAPGTLQDNKHRADAFEHPAGKAQQALGHAKPMPQPSAPPTDLLVAAGAPLKRSPMDRLVDHLLDERVGNEPGNPSAALEALDNLVQARQTTRQVSLACQTLKALVPNERLVDLRKAVAQLHAESPRQALVTHRTTLLASLPKG